MTVASGDPTLTFEYVHILNFTDLIKHFEIASNINLVILSLHYRLKEFIKEQLIVIPVPSRAPTPTPPQPQPPSPLTTAISDPGAILAGLL